MGWLGLVATVSTPAAPSRGPCQPWITAADVAEVCTLEGTAAVIYDLPAEVASDVLFELSGRQFPGVCERTVRPCEGPRCPNWDRLWPGTLYWGWACGCCEVSKIPLAGYPIRAVTEVKINGDVIDPADYRLDRNRWLVYLEDPATGLPQSWPGCQRLDRDDTEDGTFSVTYEYGAAVPAAGLLAAAELACQLATAATGGECALPPGTTRVTRQGITVDLEKAQAALMSLPLVSLFLATYNPAGLRRRSSMWSPDLQPFAQQVGP